MSNELTTRPENMPRWAFEEFHRIDHRLTEIDGKLDNIVQQVETMLTDALEKFSDRLDACVDRMRDTVADDGEKTRVNAAQLAGQIQGAIAAVRGAANEVLEHRQELNQLHGKLDSVDHRIRSLEIDGKKLYQNGTGNGAEQ